MSQRRYCFDSKDWYYDLENYEQFLLYNKPKPLPAGYLEGFKPIIIPKKPKQAYFIYKENNKTWKRVPDTPENAHLKKFPLLSIFDAESVRIRQSLSCVKISENTSNEPESPNSDASKNTTPVTKVLLKPEEKLQNQKKEYALKRREIQEQRMVANKENVLLETSFNSTAKKNVSFEEKRALIQPRRLTFSPDKRSISSGKRAQQRCSYPPTSGSKNYADDQDFFKQSAQERLRKLKEDLAKK